MKFIQLTILFISILSSPSWSETLTMDDLMERNGLYFKKFTNVPFSGSVVQNCPKGKPKDIFQEGFSGKIVNGLREDYWIITFCLSSSIQRGNFLRGKREGLWEFYYGDGQLERIGYFKENMSHGTWKFYDKWGRLVTESTYDRDNLIYMKNYDEKENLINMGPYKDGKPSGIWKFFEDGQLTKTVKYQ